MTTTTAHDQSTPSASDTDSHNDADTTSHEDDSYDSSTSDEYSSHEESTDGHSSQDESIYSSHDVVEDEKCTPRMQWRLLAISSLSCLLVTLLVSFGFQLMELYQSNDIKSSSASLDNSFIKKIKSQRILDLLSTDLTAPNPPGQINTYATRIYTHSSLSSKNYRAGGVLSDDMLTSYEQNGVLVIRNLIPPKLLDRLDEAGEILIRQQQENSKGNTGKGKQFHLVKNGAIFLGVPPPECSNDQQCTLTESNTTTILSSFRDLAMYSKIPRVAASLLRLDELRVGRDNLNVGSKLSRERSRRRHNNTEEYIDESINLRICRDIFLTKDDDEYACGWHVDDTGFWPSVASDVGVNAWVALDDMPWPWAGHVDGLPEGELNRNGDGHDVNSPVATFALSLGSHKAQWKEEAYHITGSTHTQTAEGFQSAADLVERRTGSGTCNIQTSAPHLYEKLEQGKVIYNLKRGDVIFHDRWIFHRTVTMKEYAKMSGRDARDATNNKIFKRYSIRYTPGTARVPPGYGFELSTLYNPQNANSTLNEIVERDGPFYPKVWPHVTKKIEGEEIDGLMELVYDKIPRAELIQKERKREVHRLLSARGRH